MNMNDNKMTLCFSFEELKQKVLDTLSVAEISQSANFDSSRHYIGDERQDEFVETHLRLAVWEICASLSGWNATTDFDPKETFTINLRFDNPIHGFGISLLEGTVREWICSVVLCRALKVMTDDNERISSCESMEENLKQRVLSMLCSAEMLRKVG